MDRISIIIPVYNCEEYVVSCLRSALAQKSDVYELEIVVVNDGSTDNSEDRILKFKDKEIVYVKQENGGLSAARNAGLRNSTGDLVFYLDSDDELPRNAISSLYNRYLETHDDIIIGKVRSFTSKGYEEYYSNKYISNMKHITYLDYPQLLDIISVCGKLYVKDRIDGIFFINRLIHEDNYYTLMLLLNGLKCSLLPRCVYLRRIREGENVSITQKLGLATFRDLLLNYYRVLDNRNVDLTINRVMSRKTTRYIARYVHKSDVKKAKHFQYRFWKKLDEHTQGFCLMGIKVRRAIWMFECDIYKVLYSIKWKVHDAKSIRDNTNISR